MQKYGLLKTKNYFTFYPCSNDVRPVVIIAPGGGYKYTSLRESECVAKAFNSCNFHACVVNYRETLDVAPMPELLYAKTVDYLRNNKNTFKIDGNKIIGLGFSAGGHTVLSSQVHEKILEQYKSAKLNIMLLAYPVVSSDYDICHKVSFEYLLGDSHENQEMRDYYSLEKHIKADIAPTFLWHTLTDESVPVENSLRLIAAYKKVNANIEFHMFPLGGHGLSLANSDSSMGDLTKENPYITKWVGLAIDYIKLKLDF